MIKIDIRYTKDTPREDAKKMMEIQIGLGNLLDRLGISSWTIGVHSEPEEKVEDEKTK